LLVGDSLARIAKRQNRELTFRIPEGVTEGCNVPLHLIKSGRVAAGSIAMAISKSGACRQDAYQPSNAWLSRKTGIAARVHGQEWSLENDAAASTVDFIAAFFDGDASSLAPGPLLQFPPVGLCASGHRSYARGTPTIDLLLPLLFSDLSGVELDSGDTLAVDDGHNLVRIPKAIGRSGLFWRNIASSREAFHPLKTDGPLHLRVPGGRDVGPFVATLPPPVSFEWVDRPSSPVLNLRNDVTVKWKATEDGVVLLAVVAFDPAEAQFSYCLCAAARGTSRFRIPGRVLAGLVSSLGDIREAGGVLYLMQLPGSMGNFSSAQLPTTAALSLQMVSGKVILRR